MKTIEEIKEICGMSNNMGMDDKEYRIYDRYTDLLSEAWQEWPDEVTCAFWEGIEKPKNPTESFKKDYYANFEFEDLQF